MATVDDKKVIFSMVGVSKNGAGKSTLMKIIAGLDQQYQGNVVWSPGYSVGYLPQDPPLDETKTVKENVMEGVQHVYDALAEYDEINVKFGLEADGASGRVAGCHRLDGCVEYGLETGSCDGSPELSSWRLERDDTLGW